MNPKKEKIDKFLETYIPSPSSEDMEADGARVLRRLKSERRNAPKGDSPMKVSRAWWQPVAAAVLIGMVGIGLYAAQRGGFLPAIFSVQRESSPQVGLPTTQSPAPSVKAVAETTQVAVMTPGSTKPGAGLSRKEILAAQIAAAQAADAGAARPKFAVASVRPVALSPLNAADGFWCLGVDGRWGVSGQVSPAQGRCTGVEGLIYLVFRAYSSYSELFPYVDLAITGIPRDLAITNFQINAVADNPERVTKGELRLMVRTLLEDRFKARVHLETRELDGYILTIAKSGIKFKEASGEEQNLLNPSSCSGLRGRLANWKAKCRMETLTAQLSLTLGYTPVLDKTGLTGLYDINLSLNEIPMGGPAPLRGAAGGGPPPPRQFSPPLPKAVEEQLGLHLERGKVPVEFVVVDHIESPTEN